MTYIRYITGLTHGGQSDTRGVFNKPHAVALVEAHAISLDVPASMDEGAPMAIPTMTLPTWLDEGAPMAMPPSWDKDATMAMLASADKGATMALHATDFVIVPKTDHADITAAHGTQPPEVYDLRLTPHECQSKVPAETDTPVIACRSESHQLREHRSATRTIRSIRTLVVDMY